MEVFIFDSYMPTKCAFVHMEINSVHILSREMHKYTYIIYIVIQLSEKKEKWGRAYNIFTKTLYKCDLYHIPFCDVDNTFI